MDFNFVANEVLYSIKGIFIVLMNFFAAYGALRFLVDLSPFDKKYSTKDNNTKSTTKEINPEKYYKALARPDLFSYIKSALTRKKREPAKVINLNEYREKKLKRDSVIYQEEKSNGTE